MPTMTMVTPTWRTLGGRRSRQLIAGIDEVGRGAWAGPVVAAAVILPAGFVLPGLRDSKLLTPAARRRLDRAIRRHALSVGIGWVAAGEIDERGLSWAVRESGLRALAGLDLSFDLVLLDGSHNYLDGLHPARAVIKADAHLVPVAAASVIAKVARDQFLSRLARRHPGYGFEVHKGYGTAAHRAALAELGTCPLHRLSFAPLRGTVSVG